jgi:hypothetical protein
MKQRGDSELTGRSTPQPVPTISQPQQPAATVSADDIPPEEDEFDIPAFLRLKR